MIPTSKTIRLFSVYPFIMADTRNRLYKRYTEVVIKVGDRIMLAYEVESGLEVNSFVFYNNGNSDVKELMREHKIMPEQLIGLN